MSNEINKNKSPSSAYGQWQNFSMGLQKLGDYSTNLRSSRRLTPVKQEQEWFSDVASGVADLSSKFYKDYEDRTNLKVETYRNAKSLEDIQKDIVEKKVPFQNDALAMTLLKRNVGNMYSTLADQEFSSRIARGEFVGKSPEEVDKAKFEHRQKTLEELRQSNALDFENPQDQAFLYGFYENSYKSRMLAMAQNDELTSKHYTDEALRTDETGFANQFSTGVHSVEDVEASFEASEQTIGYRATATEKASSLGKKIGYLAGNGECGTEILTALRNKKVKGTDVTYEAYLGGKDVWDKYVSDSVLAKYTRDATAMYKFQSDLSQLSANPTAENMAKLNGMLEASLKRSGGVKTWESELIYKQIEAGNKKLRGETAENTSKIQVAQAVSILSPWVTNKLTVGDERNATDIRKQLRENKIPDYIADVVYEQLVSEELYGENSDPTRVSRTLGLIASGDFGDTHIRNFVSGTISKDLTSFRRSMLTFEDEGIMPSDVDQVTGDFDYAPVGRISGAILQGITPGLKRQLDLFQRNPSAYRFIASKEDYELMTQVDFALQTNTNPVRGLANAQKVLSKYDKDQRKSFERDITKKAEIIGTSYWNTFFGWTGIPHKETPNVSPYMVNMALADAVDYAKKNPDSTVTEQFDYALKKVNNEFMGFNGVTIPMYQVQNAFPDYQIGGLALRDKIKSGVEDVLKKELDIPEDKIKTYLDNSKYSYREEAIVIMNQENLFVTSIPLRSLKKYIENKELEEREALDKSKFNVGTALEVSKDKLLEVTK